MVIELSEEEALVLFDMTLANKRMDLTGCGRSSSVVRWAGECVNGTSTLI